MDLMPKSKSRPRKAKSNRRRTARHRTLPGAAASVPRYEWVTVEERDEEGRFVMPRAAVGSTASTVYDPSKHTDLKLRILKGYAPDGVIIGQYKLYDISLLSMKGWRVKVHAAVDLGGRAHEEAWFGAYQGQTVILEDPGLRNTDSDEYELTVTVSSFDKKIVRVRAADGLPGPERWVYEGTLTLVETWSSAYRRHTAELGKRAAIGLIGGLIGFAAKTILDILLRPA